MTLCTLFNVNYLDKGLALYESLERVSNNFVLYVLAMDDKCYEILKELNFKSLVPIKLSDFESEELLKVKLTRSVGEYCWTCSSNLIRYVIDTYEPEYCTYVDADLYFYSDPYQIIQEMKQKNASVQVIGHRFNKGEEKQRSFVVGKYCVEFNTFKNDKKGNELLNIWCKQCLDYCKIDGDGVHWADQKYQDNWCDDYDFCIETEHLGAGVAPWNISQYKFVESNELGIFVKIQDRLYPMLFYHFENLQYIDKYTIKINVYHQWGIDDVLVKQLYYPYLKVVDKYKTLINSRYGIDILIKHHPGVDIKDKKNMSVFRMLSKLWKIFTPQFLRNYLFVVLPTRLYKGRDFLIIN